MHKGMPKALRQTLFPILIGSFFRHATALVLFTFFIATPALSSAQDPGGVRPLLTHNQFQSILSEDTQVLDDATALEWFLDAIDGAPPNWKAIYGEDGAGHDERLFTLNRERDRLREERHARTSQVTFLWAGELSGYDAERGGFHVAIGPKLIPTQWGVVRFKPEDLPSNLVAIPPPMLNALLQKRVRQGERIEVEVAITGRLLPDESIIYDFAHDEPGQGMVMPVVRVERMDYVLKE